MLQEVNKEIRKLKKDINIKIEVKEDSKDKDKALEEQIKQFKDYIIT